MNARKRSRAEELSSATPASRNRYVDLLRVLSIVVVVLGHWTMAVLGYEHGTFTGKNLLEIDPGVRIITWVFQVVPIFFVVGGFTNSASWTSARRREQSYGDWLRARCARLLRPAIAFVAVWTLIPVVGVLAGVLPSGIARTGGDEVALPLWFMAAYLMTVAATPPLLAMHERFGVKTFVPLVLGTVLVDVARYGGGLNGLGVRNHAFVWLAVLELGFLWRDGVLGARRVAWVMLAVGVALLIGLVTVENYPISMVGLTHADRSNTFPPSLALLALAIAQMGAVLLFEEPANRWLQRPRVWLAVALANSMVMTFYLWNMTAAVLAAVLLFPTGLAPQPRWLSTAWWFLRPAWIGVCAICLLPFLFGFRWTEREGRPARSSPAGSLGSALAVGGVVCAGAGFAVLAAVAFPVPHEEIGTPSLGVALVGVGSLLLAVDPLSPLKRRLNGSSDPQTARREAAADP